MTEGDATAGALKETTVFLSHFKDLPDYRQKGKVAYPLEEVLLLLLAAALAGAETVADIARFGRAKLAFLQRFRRFDNGTPSHDQLGNILANLDPAAFQRCFVAWAAALTKKSAEVIAIDGKTVRRSYQKKGAEEPIHIVSAFAARQRMVLGQTRVGDKSNEIVAIPALLELLAIEGAVVTIDAAGCQRKIAQTIIDKKADYILALKGNQGTLRDDVELFAREQKAVAFKNTSVSQDTTVDGDHGRIETRTVTVFHDIGWLQDSHQWPGLKSVVMVESERETNGKAETETRFYITSLTLLANAVGPMIRSHWMVENGLHWVLDMIFRDDECRVRTDNAPFNLAIVKHIALNVLRTGKAKELLAHATQSRRLGRKRPRRLHRRMTRSVDSPGLMSVEFSDALFRLLLPVVAPHGFKREAVAPRPRRSHEQRLERNDGRAVDRGGSYRSGLAVALNHRLAPSRDERRNVAIGKGVKALVRAKELDQALKVAKCRRAVDMALPDFGPISAGRTSGPLPVRFSASASAFALAFRLRSTASASFLFRASVLPENRWPRI